MKIKEIIDNEEWPEAIDTSLLCNSENDKFDRAENILKILKIPYNEKRFLDYGCGEGHLAILLNKKNQMAYGYDIKKSGSLTWEEIEKGHLLTTDSAKIQYGAPYDIILLHDVLDHCESPIETLIKMKSFCDSNTKIYIRCHPWCSRHGGHLYHKLNKAFAHLVLDENELPSNNLPIKRVIHPQASYTEWFYQSNLQILESSEDITPVENFFFEEKIIRKTIQKHWLSFHEERLKSGKDFPEYQLSQNFRDYILKVK